MSEKYRAEELEAKKKLKQLTPILDDARAFQDGLAKFDKENLPPLHFNNPPLPPAEQSKIFTNNFETAKERLASDTWKAKHQAYDDSHGLRGYPTSATAEDDATVQRNIDEKGLVLERPQGSSLHHAIDELSSRGLPAMVRNFLGQHFQSFVIEHDWAGAFDKATDFDKGEVRLPFQFTAFEFRISGQRIIVALGETDTIGIVGVLLVGVNKRWYVPASQLTFKDGRLGDPGGDGDRFHMGAPLLELLTRQIRAVCIVLDAEVAEKTAVRVSEKLARHYAKTGKTPMKDYHVVSLAKRHKVSRPETSEPSDRRRPRLHFRRGHWRHFPDHRTWIEWMLVGDPDLGFVDKHYRL